MQAVIDMVNHSPIVSYAWLDRGRAPRSYLQGMALVYLQARCTLGSDPRVKAMAVCWDGENDNDVLHFCADDFAVQGLDNSATDEQRLRHLFVLMIGLGMRESSGRWCEGRDRTVEHPTADSAESGLFQVSWDLHYGTPGATDLLHDYLQRQDPFASFFKQGVDPRQSDLEVVGEGDGARYQRLAKEKPGFAVYLAALGLRSNARHWGPVIRHEFELRPEANDLLKEVEAYACEHSLCPLFAT